MKNRVRGFLNKQFLLFLFSRLRSNCLMTNNNQKIMKLKHTLSLLFLLSAFAAMSQDVKDAPTLRVTGKAELKVAPTIIVVSLRVNSVDSTYNGAVKKLISRVELLTETLKKIGFEENQIITTDFNVGNNVVRTRSEFVQKGFKASQQLKIQFQQNKDRLLQVLNNATSSQANPSIDISFKLDEQSKRKLKAELIKLAVKDAMKKSELITEQAGYVVSGIKTIDYSTRNFNDEVFMVAEYEITDFSDSEVNITSFGIGDLSFKDFVKITYYISKKE